MLDFNESSAYGRSHDRVFPNYGYIHARHAAFMEENTSGKFWKRSLYVSLGYLIEHASRHGYMIITDFFTYHINSQCKDSDEFVSFNIAIQKCF